MTVYNVCPIDNDQPYGSDGGSGIEANTPRDAAEKWAQEMDGSTVEYLIAGKQQDAVVVVTEANTGRKSQWTVIGETVPVYRARPVNPPPLARGDVKTGKVITSAELIASTDTPEIRGAVAPEGGGRHT